MRQLMVGLMIVGLLAAVGLAPPVVAAATNYQNAVKFGGIGGITTVSGSLDVTGIIVAEINVGTSGIKLLPFSAGMHSGNYAFTLDLGTGRAGPIAAIAEKSNILLDFDLTALIDRAPTTAKQAGVSNCANVVSNYGTLGVGTILGHPVTHPLRA